MRHYDRTPFCVPAFPPRTGRFARPRPAGNDLREALASPFDDMALRG